MIEAREKDNKEKEKYILGVTKEKEEMVNSLNKLQEKLKINDDYLKELSFKLKARI
jgi:hypothetical protein